MQNPNVLQVIKLAKTEIIEAYASHLQILLQEKHLYQKVDVPVSSIVIKHRAELVSGHHPAYDSEIKNFTHARFFPSEGASYSIGRVGLPQVEACLLLRNVKLYCTKCKSKEAYTPVWSRDLANELLKPSPYGGSSYPFNNDYQLFFLAYQCQICKGDPEALIVRRRSNSLIFEGRSPMEETLVPSEIPKPEKHYFSDAVIAYNSGKELAGLFYLRTFIEQFARRVTGLSGMATGTELMDSYGQTLPHGQRDHMPSLKDWFGKLSEAIHEAKAGEGLFEDALEKVTKHFKIRQVFDMPEKIPEK